MKSGEVSVGAEVRNEVGFRINGAEALSALRQGLKDSEFVPYGGEPDPDRGTRYSNPRDSRVTVWQNQDIHGEHIVITQKETAGVVSKLTGSKGMERTGLVKAKGSNVIR